MERMVIHRQGPLHYLHAHDAAPLNVLQPLHTLLEGVVVPELHVMVTPMRSKRIELTVPNNADLRV